MTDVENTTYLSGSLGIDMVVDGVYEGKLTNFHIHKDWIFINETPIKKIQKEYCTLFKTYYLLSHTHPHTCGMFQNTIDDNTNCNTMDNNTVGNPSTKKLKLEEDAILAARMITTKPLFTLKTQ